MLNLDLKINGTLFQLDSRLDVFTNTIHAKSNPMVMDVLDQSTTPIRKSGWLAKRFAGGLKGETVHRISDCMVELLDDFQIAPLDAHSPFGPLSVAIEVFSRNSIVRKINILAISPKMMKLGLPCRAEIILNQFNECCTRFFGSPATLFFSPNPKSGDDIFRVWGDADSVVKSWCHNRKEFVAMWEIIPRTSEDTP